MNDNQKGSFYKHGIWIKEQQGHLTIGSLNKNDNEVKIIPDHIKQTIQDMEADMIEALYGEESVSYESETIYFDNLFKELENKFKDHQIRISFSGDQQNVFKGDFQILLTIFEKMIQSSLIDGDQNPANPIIYINASLIDNHLCIIYRDSESLCHPSKIKKVILYIKNKLHGEVSYKATSGEKSYFDIMIPSRSR